MLPEIARFSLILAFTIAIIQIVIPLLGLSKKNMPTIQVAFSAAFAQCLFVAIAFFLLIISFIRHDFSIAYVAQNSNTHMPLLYLFCAVWGAHAGSLLLWIFVLTLWSAFAAFFNRKKSVEVIASVLIVMSFITVFFYVFLFLHSNPFLRLFPAPLQGNTLNPILLDPGLLFHPPILYLGYVGFSVVFAFAVVALITGKNTVIKPSLLRPWVMSSWCFLTIGIVLGSWWSYRELGWGGFWFWDPVENASVLPWLVAAALMHTLLIDNQKNQLSSMSLFLSLCVFSLSLLGTFLVRSGVLISVHTFSVDPARGLFLLRVCLIVSGAAFLLYALRINQWLEQKSFYLMSQESFIFINTILLLCAMSTILLGTLYPLILTILGFEKISVGAPYFNIVLTPILMLALFFMGLSVLIRLLKNQSVLFIRTVKLFFVTLIITSPVIIYFYHAISWDLFLLLLMAVWVIACVFFYIKHNLWDKVGMLISHAGLAVTVIGIVFCVVSSSERQVVLSIGQSAYLSGYQFILQKITNYQKENFTAIEATIQVEKNNQVITTLFPQLREFADAQLMLPKAGIHVGLVNDYYVALGNPLTRNRWLVQLDIKPLVRWIWFGGVMMAIGGIVALISNTKKYKGL